MTIDENKQLYMRYVDALRHPEKLGEFLAPDFVAYDLTGQHIGPADLIKFREGITRAGRESFTADFLIAEGNLVASHQTVSIELVTGEQATFHVIEIVEIKDGRIAWRRVGLDHAGHALGPRVDKIVGEKLH